MSSSDNEYDASDNSDNASVNDIKSLDRLMLENEEHGREIKELKASVATYVADLERQNQQLTREKEEQKKQIEALEQKIKTMNELLSGSRSTAGEGHHIMKLDADTTCWFWTRQPPPADF